MTDDGWKWRVIYDAIARAEQRGLNHDAMVEEMAANPAVREFVIKLIVEQAVGHVNEICAAVDRGLATLDEPNETTNGND